MSWLSGYGRHMRSLGFVPPEFQNHGRIVEDPDTLGYTLDLGGAPNVKTLSAAQLRKACDAIIPPHEQEAIQLAANLAHAGDDAGANHWRDSSGYGGC